MYCSATSPQHNLSEKRNCIIFWNSHSRPSRAAWSRDHTMAIPDAAFSAIRFCSVVSSWLGFRRILPTDLSRSCTMVGCLQWFSFCAQSLRVQSWVLDYLPSTRQTWKKWLISTMSTIVRENVWSKAKKRKKSRFFGFWKKNVKKR